MKGRYPLVDPRKYPCARRRSGSQELRVVASHPETQACLAFQPRPNINFIYISTDEGASGLFWMKSRSMLPTSTP